VSAAGLVDSIALFEAVPPDERDHLARLMHPFALSAGATLFRDGDPGDAMYLVESGRLQARRPAPSGATVALAELGPGDVIGEMSMMGPGTRTLTVTALEDTRGWALERAVFDMLRADLRPGSLALIRKIGTLAIERLRGRYARIASELGPLEGRAVEAVPPGPLEQVAAAPDEIAYLGGTLLFSRLERDAIAAIVDGARRLHAPRGAVVFAIGDVAPAFYVVARGALELTVRGAQHVRRVRLAGPGRAVAHLGVLGPEPSLVECRARERSILLELPWPRVNELRAGTDAGARGFVAALSEDVVRALRDAERPLAAMAATRSPARD
jgi:CRP-like cAMP-binding protein